MSRLPKKTPHNGRSMKEYLELFLAFLKMGCFTFGGGYAMIPVVERELIKKRAWVTMDEVMEYYTIAQITPGIIAVNLATFVGYKKNGPFGGLFATLGFVFPGVSFVMAAALFINNFAEFPVVQHAFTGIRIAVGALILDTAIKMVKSALKDTKALAIYIIVFALAVFPVAYMPTAIPAFLKSPVFLVLSSGLAGLFIYRQKKSVSAADTKADK
jgi:chromate transporter